MKQLVHRLPDRDGDEPLFVFDGGYDPTPAVNVGTIEGILLQWIVDPEAISLEKMGEPILDVLLGGLEQGKAD